MLLNIYDIDSDLNVGVPFVGCLRKDVAEIFEVLYEGYYLADWHAAITVAFTLPMLCNNLDPSVSSINLRKLVLLRHWL